MNLTFKQSLNRRGLKSRNASITATFLLLTSLFSSNVWSEQDSYSIAAPEPWVQVKQTPASDEKNDSKARRGVYYRLADKQINVIDSENRSSYYAWEYKLTNTTGVANNSTIEITFDPSYESIVLHEVGVIRDDQFISKLSITEFELLQTEDELEDLIYNGTKTLTGILQDVRVGDTIRYSYTLKGHNPVFDDLIEYNHRAQYYVAMESSSFRLLADAYTPMVSRKRDVPDTFNLTQTISDGIRIFEWAANDLKPKKSIENVNEWSRFQPSFSISSAVSWEDIVKWSLPKYTLAPTQSDELKRIAKHIDRTQLTKEGKIGAALQWVQNEIRYFGIELGANSHNPSSPEETLDKRFGDCKDKTVLLISILRELGIESHPALVSTDGALRNEDNLHRLHAFNHVIVHLELYGKKHWIDPTRTNQLGALGEIYEPDYGFALVIAEGQHKLTKMSDEYSSFDVTLIKQLDIDRENENAGTLSIWTNRKGLSAEYHRGYVSNYGLASISENYIKYYRDRYNSIEVDSELQNKEAYKNSNFTIENYAVDDLWLFDNDDLPYFEVEADETIRYLKTPKAPRYRKVAYAIEHPINVSENFIVKLPNNLDGDEAQEIIKNKHFTYTVNVKQSRLTNSVNFTHSYVSHSHEVPVEDLRQYTKDVKRARELTSFYIDKNGFEFMNDEEPTDESTAASTFDPTK